MFFFVLCLIVQAQTQDTIVSKHTTLENIQTYSQKNSFFKSLNKLLFTPNARNQKEIRKLESIQTPDYNLYEGKIIRNINIQTFDPLGYSISDSTKLPKNKIEKGGNWLHIKTKKLTIRNLLLFKPNQPLDSLEIKETERLIRSQRYVREISITPIALQNNPDSVDLNIKVLDSWSIYPTGTISGSGGTLRLIDRNFGGLGHYFSNQYSTRFSENLHALRSQYQINNVGNTFINVGAIYQIDFEKNYQKSIYVERPFYSPLAKYAGGTSLTQQFYRDSIPDLFNNNKNTNIKYDVFDFWLARSFRLNTKSPSEITNFITAIRYNVINYKEKPLSVFDSNRIFSNHNMVLGSLAISSNTYVQTKYLFNYGIVEDIAIGKIFSITGGYQWQSHQTRPYVGAKFSLGKYINRHFYGFETEWGSYYNKSKLEQTTFRAKAIYFSKAFEYKSWRFRQFLNAEVVYGTNRLNFIKDKISLNGVYGIEGFNSSSLLGTKKILLSMQMQSYAPGQWLGFRFSPYFSADFGWIGDKYQQFVTNDLYSKIAIGIMINNDYLVFQNIQLSLAYYPTIPGVGRDVLRTNNVRNDNFDLMRFNNVKPVIVSFQ